MENKINIAELLKDCPKGMELDCTMFENVVLEEVTTVRGLDDKKRVKIILSTHYSDGTKDEIILTEFGTYTNDETAKCVIFPKGKTTWEGFMSPCQFKGGDIVVSSLGNIHILKNHSTSYIYVNFAHNSKGSLCKSLTTCVNAIRLATEEEKAKLFQAIKDKGYKWNPETKTLEKLPKFKIGDEIVKKNSISNSYIVNSVSRDYYGLIIPNKTGIGVLNVSEQDDWELVPDNFDVTTLKPFDKVLARHGKDNNWTATFFSHIDEKLVCHCYKFVTTNGSYPYVIPYEENKHLLGTTADCDDYYKTN